VSTYQLGIIFLKAGLFLESHTDYTNLAFRYFGLAAKAPYYENGQLIKFTVALRKLGVLSLKGIGTAKNPFAAFSYIQEAAEQSDEPANILLGQMYLMGLGCPVDRLRAMQIFSRYQHNIAAKLSRALLIMKENPQHAYKDFVDVIGFKCTSFDEEHWDCKSIKYEAGVRVAVWEYNGIGGTEKNPARAFRTLKILSEECGYSGAHYWLAWAYLDGVTLEKGEVLVPKDQDKAFDCFLRGAKQNKAECQYQVGLMLKEGYSKSKYTKKDAFDFFLAAANRDLPIALTQVGVYYYSGGLGTQGRDPKKAFQYFTAAAKHNDSLAIQYLADYLIKDNTNGPIEPYHIYNGLNYAAAVKKDPIAYRMLALVVNSRIDPKDTYESPDSKHQVHKDLLEIYNVAKADYINNSSTIRFQFALQCLWKAIELGDHSSGQYLCNFCPKMNDNDIIKTLEVFEKVETGVANK
jgi:TPR repeat protein